MRRGFVIAAFALAPLLLLVFAIGALLFLRQGGFAPYRVPSGPGGTLATTPALIERGAYVARLGNCASCHSVRGGVPLSGGRAFTTQWHTPYTTSLTPDKHTGLGDWSVEEFRHAMRAGVSRNGVLYRRSRTRILR